MKHSRHLVAALLGAAALAAAGSGVASADHHGRERHAAKSQARMFTLSPDPAANPEGVAFSKRLGAFFVSDTGSGAIYRGTLGNPTVSPFIPGAAGHSAVGLKVVRGKLYAAGGSAGTITVYDLASKQPVAQFDTGSGGFLNDLVVTRRGDVYVTDSTRPVLWHVTAAQVAAGSGTPQGIDVSQDIPFAAGFNLNGIVADGDRRLVTVQTNTGRLFRLQLSRDGAAIRSVAAIKGVSVPGGDGLLPDGGRLLVVQGGPPAQISFVRLHHGDRRGEVRAVRTSPLLRGPSTIDRARDLYLVVNADFATSTKPFTVAGLPRDGSGNQDRGDDNGNQDRGDDNGNGNAGQDPGDGHDPSATPTPYYAAPTPTATATPYYGGTGGGDDHGGGGNSGPGGGGGSGGPGGGGSGGGCYYCGGHS